METMSLFGQLPEQRRPKVVPIVRREVEQEPDPDALAFLGRESNKSLSFRKYAASKHCQYFTPLEFSKVLAQAMRRLLGEKAGECSVLDPTCGSGRLLLPWKQAGNEVLGIELDTDAAATAKQLLGKEAVRVGDVLDYLGYLKGGWSVVVTNPPYGLNWDVEGRTEDFGDFVDDDRKTIGCELAVMAGIFHALENGYADALVAAILPEGYCRSEGHKKLFAHDSCSSEFHLLADVRVLNLFKSEYGIDVTVRLQLILHKTMYSEAIDDVIHGEIDCRQASWPREFAKLLAQVETPRLSLSNDSPRDSIPDISRLIDFTTTNDVRLTARGIDADPGAAALLQYHDKTFTQYDPVRGIQGGAITATASKVALLSRGPEPARQTLADLGYVVSGPNELDTAKLEEARRRYEFLGAPLMQPNAHDLLAYFLDRPYEAQKTHRADGKTIWKQGRSYHFRPGWIRCDNVTKRELIPAAKPYVEIQRRESGYLKIEIETETGTLEVSETEAETVKQMVEVFGLPEIQDATARYPELINGFRRAVANRFPFLFDYQADDAAALATKPTGYLGYDMGGGKTVTSAVWASLRQYKRVLVVCQSGLIANWLAEFKKFGFAARELRSHRAVASLRAQVRANKKSVDKAKAGTTFFVTSYDFLGGGDKVFDPWTCHREREGCDDHHVENNTGHRCRQCGQSYLKAVPSCPLCGEKKNWTGFCRACGHRAFTYGFTDAKTGFRSYPAIKYLRKLFGAVVVDEAQEMKSKTSLRGQAVRSIRAGGRLALTGTIMKGYVTDIYWTMGWLLGHDTPLFPYPFVGGAKTFLNEFATYDFVDREFEDTLCKGRAKLIPEVSNLNRFRRLLAPMSIRRVKSAMPELKKLPPKHRHVEHLPMTREHADLYWELEEAATKAINKEMLMASQNGREVNMGVISRNLWMLIFAATIPTSGEHLPTSLPKGVEFNKLTRVLELVNEAKAVGDKVLIFSGLRDMQAAIADHLEANGVKITQIFASAAPSERVRLINEFSADPSVTAIVTGLNVLNRGFNITASNRVIVCDIGWSPEAHRQGEDRVHRPGQAKECHVHYLFSAGTVDQHIYGVTELKQKAIDQAIDGKIDTATANVLRECSGNIKMAVARLLIEESQLPVVNAAGGFR